MKKKGFTLIELLAVIVILAIIALIATPVILGIINNVKEEANKRSIEMYAKAVENAVALNQLTSPDKIIGSFTSQNEGKELVQQGKPPVNIDYDGKVECDTIEIYADGSMYIADCTVDEHSVDYTYGKNYICEAVDDKVTPNRPPYTGYNSGDAYDCKVKKDTWYRFYILSVDEDNVNLIAQQNITPTGEFTENDQEGDEWHAPDWDNTYGPQNIYKYLSNATANWKNIPIIENFVYDDEGNRENSDYGYESIITKLDSVTGDYITTIRPNKSSSKEPATYQNMRVRLPYLSEITENTNCKLWSRSTPNEGTCPLWMVNYLVDNKFYSSFAEHVAGKWSNLGYWILTTSPTSFENNHHTYYIDGYGNLSYITPASPYPGARPVITISKAKLLQSI